MPFTASKVGLTLALVAFLALMSGCRKPPPVSETSPAPVSPAVSPTEAPTAAAALPKTALLVVAPDGVRAEEYQEPRKALEDAGVQVKVASVSAGTATLTDNAQITVDLAAADANAADYDAIVFIGGPGMASHLNEPSFVALAQACKDQEGKVVAAICVAPSILANAGLLGGKKATAWHGEADTLRAVAAEYVDAPVVQDGNIITANGPAAAKAFAQKLVDALK